MPARRKTLRIAGSDFIVICERFFHIFVFWVMSPYGFMCDFQHVGGNFFREGRGYRFLTNVGNLSQDNKVT
jgi:hypothetical protein